MDGCPISRVPFAREVGISILGKRCHSEKSQRRRKNLLLAIHIVQRRPTLLPVCPAVTATSYNVPAPGNPGD